MALWKPWDITLTIVLSSAISIIAFFLTASLVTVAINKERLVTVKGKINQLKQTISTTRGKENDKAVKSLARYYLVKSRTTEGLTENEIKDLEIMEEQDVLENQESPAVILGMGGIYAVVNGLGITDALTKYADSMGNSISDLLPHSLRLLTFLVTIVPFIHGFILTFSNRWYYDEESDTTHYEWAFVFFMVVFFQTVLLFFAALNVQKLEIFILMLWSLMAFNAPWLFVQIKCILKDKINIVNVFPKQWIILNFITASFLSVFVFASDQLLVTTQSNILINALIFSVLLSRSIADYMVGWKGLYNRPPDPERA